MSAENFNPCERSETFLQRHAELPLPRNEAIPDPSFTHNFWGERTEFLSQVSNVDPNTRRCVEL